MLSKANILEYPCFEINKFYSGVLQESTPGQGFSSRAGNFPKEQMKH